MWAEHRREAYGTDGDASPGTCLGGGALDLGERAPETARRVQPGVLVGSGQCTAAAAVDLEAAAVHDRFEGPALCCSAEDRGGGLRGEAFGVGRVGPRLRFPHRDVHHDVRVERGDHVDHPFALVGGDEMELGAAQTPTRRVDVDADE